MPRYIQHKQHRPRHGLRYDRYVPVQRVTTAGEQQVSDDGSTNWSSEIAAGNLKVNTPVNYYVQIKPDTISPSDNATYQYTFLLIADDTPGGTGHETDGISGLSLTWNGNLAHISGKVPSDQASKKVTIRATITDMSSNTVTSTDLIGTWTS